MNTFYYCTHISTSSISSPALIPFQPTPCFANLAAKAYMSNCRLHAAAGGAAVKMGFTSDLVLQIC